MQMFRKGMIILWSGLIADIPKGWHLCDGTNDTPNLQNNFVVGAGASYVVDATGGAVSHSHPITDPGHTHNLVVSEEINMGSDWDTRTDSKTTGITVLAVSALPPYVALAYIMKL